jgi:hypothetical protein
MKRFTLADLIAARLDLARSLLQIQDGQQSYRFAQMDLHIAAAKTDLASIRYARAQIQLTTRRSQNA